MIYHDLKSFNDLDKVKTIKIFTSIKSSLLKLSSSKLLFSKTDLITAE